MRLTLFACLATALALGLASCKCGDVAEQTQGPADATKPSGGAAAGPQSAQPAESREQVVCPVCGLRFGADEAVATHEHDGKTYHFLLEDHKDAFAADPASYLDEPAP
jgi:YHS domain-containing protein